jgi:hypothetical protein
VDSVDSVDSAAYSVDSAAYSARLAARSAARSARSEEWLGVRGAGWVCGERAYSAAIERQKALFLKRVSK